MPPPWLLPLLLLLLLVVFVGHAKVGALQDAEEGIAVAKGLSSLTGLPAGLSTLLKFRSALPAAAAAVPVASAATSTTTLDPNHFIKPPVFPEEGTWPGSCRLRSKRYVSDGLCVSPRPVNEVVCAVSCVMDAWSKQGGARPVPWRCTDSGWKRQRVKLLCRDGTTRSYRIRVVQTCRCVPRRAATDTAAADHHHHPE